MLLGKILAALFIVALVCIVALALLAVIEHFPKHRGRKPFHRLRRANSRLDQFLVRNALINRPLSYLAAVVLLALALIRTAVDDMKHALLWGLQGPLWTDALWLMVVLYLLFGVTGVISELATQQALPLLRQGFSGFNEPMIDPGDQRDLDAQLAYSYRISLER